MFKQPLGKLFFLISHYDHLSLEITEYCIQLYILFGEGNGTLLQYFCLENPMGKKKKKKKKIPWKEEPGRLQSMGSLQSDMTERLHFHFSLWRIGEGNGNPLQCSCFENPRDGGAWWAAIYGVAQSWTGLKRLSSSSKHYRTAKNPPESSIPLRVLTSWKS